MRSQEQPLMDEKNTLTNEHPLGNNPKGLNDRLAASEEHVTEWAETHETNIGKVRTTVFKGGKFITNAVYGTVNILSIANLAIFAAAETIQDMRDAKPPIFSAEYEFADKNGRFIAYEAEHIWLGISWYSTYVKYYLDGPRKGMMKGMTSGRFNALKSEMRRRFGYIGWNGEFVPGTERKELPRIPINPATGEPYEMQ